VSRIPLVVHAEIVEGVRRDYLATTNRKTRRQIIAGRRAAYRKMPYETRKKILEDLNR